MNCPNPKHVEPCPVIACNACADECWPEVAAYVEYVYAKIEMGEVPLTMDEYERSNELTA